MQTSLHVLQDATQRPTGAFQNLPIVPQLEEHVRSALRRASRVPGNKSLKNKAQHARNLTARRLDALTKELATPLNRIVQGFPRQTQLHPFEGALLDLTVGSEAYDQRLGRLDALRKTGLQVRLPFIGGSGDVFAVKDITELSIARSANHLLDEHRRWQMRRKLSTCSKRASRS